MTHWTASLMTSQVYYLLKILDESGIIQFNMHVLNYYTAILPLVLVFLTIHDCKGGMSKVAKNDLRRTALGSPKSSLAYFPWFLAYRQGSAPEILNILTNRTLSPGKGVSFRCRVVGNPRPRIKWKRNGITIVQSLRVKIRHFEWGSRLRIKNIQTSDEGVYKCIAKNPQGFKASTPAYVRVKGNRKTKQGRCEVYYGRYCDAHLVYIPHGKLQSQIDRRFGKLVSMVKSARCRKQLILYICRLNYPSCPLRGNDKGLAVCREDCIKLEKKFCRRDMRILGPLWRQSFVCSKLPDANCHKLFGHGYHGQYRTNKTTAVKKETRRIPLASRPLCNRYQGGICTAYVTNSAMVTTHGQKTQGEVEKGLRRILLLLRNYTSSQCKSYLEKALCYHVFSPCSGGPNPTPNQICRLQCEVLQGRICSKEFRLARLLSPDHNILPWCSALRPSVENNDSHACLSLGINVNDNGETHGWDECSAVLKRNNQKNIPVTVMSVWRRNHTFCRKGPLHLKLEGSKISRNVLKLFPARNFSKAQITAVKKGHKITYCFQMKMRLENLVLKWEDYHRSLPLPHVQYPKSGLEVPGLQVILNQVSSKINTILLPLGSAASYRVHEKILLEKVMFFYRYQSYRGSFIAKGKYQLCDTVFDVVMETLENGGVKIYGNSSSPLDVNTIERVFGLAIPTNFIHDAIRRSEMLVMRLINPIMQIDIDKEISIKFAGQSYWTSDGHPTYLEFYGGKRYQSDVLVASLTSQSLSFDNVLRTFTGIELPSFDWIKRTRSQTRVLLSTADLNSTYNTIFRIHGKPLSTMLTGSVPAGLTIMSQTRIPHTCNESNICELAKVLFGQDSMFTIKTISKENQIIFDVAFEKFSQNPVVAYRSFKVSLNVVNGNMSLFEVLPSIMFNANGYIDTADQEDKKLPFTGQLEYNGIWAKLMGEFSIKQHWQHAFGIKHLTFKNIRASFTVSTDVIPSQTDHSINTQAEFEFGIGCTNARSSTKKDGCITGQVFLGLSEDITEHYFYGSVGSITLQQLLKACDIHVQLPSAVASIGFPSGLKISAARTMQDLSVEGGPSISPGLVMTGTINILGIESDASVSLLPREFLIDAEIDGLKIELLDEVTPLERAQHNGQYRPLLYLKTRLNPIAFLKVHIDWYSRIFGVFDEVHIFVSREAIQVKMVAEVHNSIQANVVLTSNYSKHVNATHLRAKIIFRNQLSKLTRLASKHVVNMLEAEMTQFKVADKEVKSRLKECSRTAKSLCTQCLSNTNCLKVLMKCKKERSKLPDSKQQALTPHSICQRLVFDGCKKANDSCKNLCSLVGTYSNDSCPSYRKAANKLQKLKYSLQWVRQARFLISGSLFNIHSISFEAQVSPRDLINTVVDTTFDVTIFGQRNLLRGLQLHLDSFTQLASEIAKHAVTWYDKRHRFHGN